MPRTKRSKEAHAPPTVGEVVGVVHLDVRDDRPGRVVVQEVVAELVGLHQERRSVARPAPMAPQASMKAPTSTVGSSPALDKEVAEQGGGGRLAVRAR